MIHRAADRAPAASGAARPPMSPDELDRWLRAPRQRKPAADGIAMLDGFVAAIVAGPATYEPLGWLCPLLGVTRHAINDGDTEEYAALAAAAQLHNALAVSAERGAGTLRANLRTRCPRRHRRQSVVSRLPCRHPAQSKILAKAAARPQAGAYVADPDPGALHQRRRPAGPRRAAARSSHRIGAVRRPSHDPRRCRCHPKVLGSDPIQLTLLTVPATRV